MALTQDKRFLQITTPLGKDKLFLNHFSGHEKLGCLYEYHLELLSEEPDIDFKKILGERVTVSLDMPNDKKRYFDGHVTQFRRTGVRGQFYRYQATLRPWLWFLSRTADCRIFQEMSVPDIIKQVFKDNGFSDFTPDLSASYRNWEYCVQYRETDLNFVCRLMEQEGIYFFFTHENGKHKMVLADSYSSHETFPDFANIKYFDPGDSAFTRDDYINDWVVGCEIVPGAVAIGEYNFKTSKADLLSKNLNKQDHSHGDEEIYDYPGEFTEKSEGENYARIRMDELSAQYERVQGSGTARGIAAGSLFTLKEHGLKSQNREYLAVSVSHSIQSDEFEGTSTSGSEISYQCQFEVMPASIPFRSSRVTPKPIVQGPQTAVVVGDSGEEIQTDEYGRIKVQFHWDRLGKKDAKSSCWVRVSTSWAGNQWGSIHIPRIGQEVVVSFLEGDPDRPLVTGSVYNNANMPPYTLPDHKTQSGIKSRSSKDGSDKMFNEVRFEDATDKEELRIQAQKDMNVGVKHIRKTFIGGSLDEGGEGSIDGQCPEVGDMNEQLTVFADRETIIKGNDILNIAEESDASKGRVMIIKNGDQDTTIDKGDKKTTVKLGDITRKVKAGKVLEEAAKSIEFKVGGSSIKIEPAKITIKSVQIEIKGSATVKAQAPMVDVNGSGMVKIQGGMVKIN